VSFHDMESSGDFRSLLDPRELPHDSFTSRFSWSNSDLGYQWTTGCRIHRFCPSDYLETPRLVIGTTGAHFELTAGEDTVTPPGGTTR
jgi:hypothetical protein